MEEDEEEQRRRKVEAGRAKLAHFRQRKTKGDRAHSKKKAAKRTGPAVDAPVQEASPVASEDGGGVGPGDARQSSSCSEPPEGAGAAQPEDRAAARTEDSARLQKLDADRPDQPELLTEECERACASAGAESMGRAEDEAGGHWWTTGGRPPTAEEQQGQLLAQPAAALELEALRLSLSNMHVARLELAQAHLQREKDSALTELRDMLNGRHAQELALLHSRQQLQLEELARRYHQETAELKEKLQSETEKNAQITETLKRDWESERDLCLENLRQELSTKHQAELENLRSQFKRESAELRAGLEKMSQAKNQAELSLQSLQAQQKATVKRLQEDLGSQYCRHAEDPELADGQLQNLQASQEELKAESQEGHWRLWSQLECTRTDEQELSELREWPPARAPGVEDLQQQQSEHDSRLERLLLCSDRSGQECPTQSPQRLQERREDTLLESEEISVPGVGLEETSENEGRDCLHPLSLQQEPREVTASLVRLRASLRVHTQVEESRQRQGAAQQDADVSETYVLEQRAGPLEGPGQELTRVPLQVAQDMAEEVETAVAARVLGLEAEHKVRLSLQMELKEEIELLNVEKRDLLEKLQQEIRLNEDLEKAKHDLAECHQEELRKAKEQIQLLKQEFREREAEWKVTSEARKREAEEQLTRMLLDLTQQAAAGRQSLLSEFELRETEMRQLHDQQAAQIRDLEASLVEQQGRLRQLELGLAEDECPQCSKCGREPGQDWELAAVRLKEDCALQLTLAQNRLLEQRREITEKFTVERDALLREAQERHASELRLLQDRHRQHLASLTAELQARHQADTAELRAALERQHCTLSGERAAESQEERVAEVCALEARHRSDLESVEARHRCEVEALRSEHRRALELLQASHEGQVHNHLSPEHVAPTPEFEGLEQERDAELQSAEACHGAEPGTECPESLRVPAARSGGAQQGESEKQAALCDRTDMRRLACEQPLHQRETEALRLQLQEREEQVVQLKDQVLSLSRELEELQQRRARENQEGANLIAMLKSDTALSASQRTALQDALRRLLSLFGETLKAASALKSRISERVGLGLTPSAVPALEETWPGCDGAVPELDGTLPESTEMSSEAEISSHLCESFFLSPESMLECEQPVRRIYQSLALAVDSLLEMVLDSSRQLEEARQIHDHFGKEFSCRSEEMAQVGRKHQELLERLEEENTAQTRLTLELYKAEGIIEGFKVEKASLQEALGQKEEVERGLVVELESLSQQLQQGTQQLAELKEKNAVLLCEKEAAAAEAQEREAALRREVEDVTREQAESRKQAEQDHRALRAQTEALEAELQEQLLQHQACTEQAAELCALRQQLASLDKQLRSQRHFMDEQAVEREQEREEFQQEIQRLEKQLRQAARPRPRGAPDDDRAQRDEQVEFLQEKLREKSDELGELVIKKELADRQVLIQEEEIKHLEEINASTMRKVTQLQEELEKLRQAMRELQQDKEVFQEQQLSTLLPVSTRQARQDEGRRPWPPVGRRPEGPEVQLEAVQRAHLPQDSEACLQNGENEIMCVSEQLEAQLAGIGSGTVSVSEAMPSTSSEVKELKSIIETLQENQERLQEEKAEEIERLHEVIERLQRELSLGGPMERERSPGPSQDLQSELERELLCPQRGGAEDQAALQAELHAALASREALSGLLADQEHRHGQALEALHQRLRSVEEAAARQLAQPEPGVASHIRELEAALKAKDWAVAQRDLEIETLHRRTSAHCVELQAMRSAVARIRRLLEQQHPGSTHEPPELQRLRTQCVRLSRQLQALNLHFQKCQRELDEQQACQAPAPSPGEGSAQGLESGDDEAFCKEELEHDVGRRQLTEASHGHDHGPQSPVKGDVQPAKALLTLNHAGLHHQDSVTSVLAVCQRQLESELLLVKNEMRLSAEARGKNKEKPLEDCKLRKVDLISQVKQLQEKLNCLVYSMNFQNIETEDFKSQQPLAFSDVLENSLSDSSNNGEETDKLPPVEAFTINKTTWDLVDVIGNQDSWIRNEKPNVPMGEKVDVQDGSLGSLHSSCSDLTRSEGAEPLKSALSAMDVSWSSPEAVRRDSTLEPLPSLPVTPCLDASLSDRTSTSLLQADQQGLLCSRGESAAAKAPCWAESLAAVDQAPSADPHVQRTPVEKDVEDFITTSLESQEKSRSPPLGLQGKGDESEKSDGDGVETLTQSLGGQDAPTASPAAPPPASWSFRRPLEAMKEKVVPSKHVEALLQMVCDESRHILALSEYRGPPSALGKGEPSTPLEGFPWGGQSLLEALPAPQKGEKEPPGMSLDWRGEFLQVVQEAFAKEQDMLSALQPRGHGYGPVALLSQQLEQEALQEKSPERLHLSERSSLLSEIQALRAQLRLTHLQNQEKLQQLCAALTSAEARGSQREHQLRRQVELLAYKVEQEKCIASDLQKTLSEEQEKASDVRQLLLVEENTVRALKSELCECKQDNERLLESLSDVQREVLQLRSVLDGKEEDLRAALQELESARGEERALQGRLEHERLQRLHAEAQHAQALGVSATGPAGAGSRYGGSFRLGDLCSDSVVAAMLELRVSLEKQCAQNNRLCVTLKHEQTAKDNLQRELQIEASRCEALLAQERGRLTELRRRLEAEQGRSQELSEALQHERLLTERLSRRSQVPPGQPTVPRKLKDERARVAELQAAPQQPEAEAQGHCQELEREKERELELRRQRQEHKIQQLERAAHRSPEAGRLQEQQQSLEKIRQQLLGAAGLLTSFINQTVDRTINDWTSSNEKAVTSLLRTLEELKCELSPSTCSQKNMTTQRPEQLVGILLKDNDSLRKALGAVTREKAGLCRAATRLERTLAQHLLKGCTLSRSDRSAGKRDRKVLPGSPGLPDPGLSAPATREEADASTVKMEKLYLRYLRAESFRKALIYQKKYLLLLIGGFQDSEQETLSMIAHLGVFPSKADKKIAPPRPFTKFRTAVRVVIAISRLRFLVRKWQEVDRKGALMHGQVPRPGFWVPRQQHPPRETSESPPTRDDSSSHTRDPVPKASPRRSERSSPSPNSRSERPRTASEDPERSLTEYIHHLEMIQQRLGGVPPDPTFKKSCRQKTKQ
ncbi:pericentrin isoform X7 [Rhinolophus sinicus]|uniref:pericentrin isoform X7 n=1 Tax=Rhinolophus sinicus TaxID=89399 RepID=UPI003D79EEA5